MTTLRATLLTPLSGPLALFGQASAHGLSLWANAAARLPAPYSGVELTVRDSSPNTSAVLQATLQENPDLLFGPYGTGPMLAAARATSRVIWNHGGATSRLRWPDFPHVMNVLAPSSSYFAGVLEAIHAADETIRKVALVHSTTSFGRDVALGASTKAIELGMRVQDVPFAASNPLAVASSVPDADVLLVVGTFADELALASLLLGRDWKYASFIGAGTMEVLAALGKRREGLIGPTQWLASVALAQDEGPDTSWLVARYQEQTGQEPSYPAVQAFTAGLLAARCLRDAGSCEDERMLAVARALRCTTLYGPFELNAVTGLQIGHRVLVVQWQNGERRVVWPREVAEKGLSTRKRNGVCGSW